MWSLETNNFVCTLLISFWITCTVMPYIIIICSFKCGVWGYLIFLNFGKYKTLKFYLYIFFHSYHKIHKVYFGKFNRYVLESFVMIIVKYLLIMKKHVVDGLSCIVERRVYIIYIILYYKFVNLLTPIL